MLNVTDQGLCDQEVVEGGPKVEVVCAGSPSRLASSIKADNPPVQCQGLHSRRLLGPDLGTCSHGSGY